MKKKILAALASIVGGAFLAILIRLNASLGMKIGILGSTFMAHLTGTFLALILISWRINRVLLKKFVSCPYYLYFGGIFGVLLTLVCTYVVPRLGLMFTMSVYITADLLFCALADHIGFFGLPRFRLNIRRFAGLILAVIGLGLIFWG